MKKSLIALAVLAAAGTASAQSSVTLFGVVDAAVEHISNRGAASGTRMTQGGNTRSNFGLRGTEDLGGGMAASFWLEADVAVDDGTGGATNSNNQSTGATGGATGLVFNARSTLSLSGNWGELRLGRDYSPAFRSITAFDPFGTRGVGTTQILTGNGGPVAMLANGFTNVRASNSIGYFLPAMGGVYGELKYWLGENASNAVSATGADTSRDGRGGGIRVGYASGPFNIAGAYDRTKYATGNYTEANIGGSWDFGMAKVMALVERDKSGSVTGKGWQIGGIVPVGAGDIKASYSRYRTDVTAASPTAKKLALGYVHNLSKRTALYVTYARVKNSGGSTMPVQTGFGSPLANQSSTGYDLGLKHSF
jgi:predicted porin